jgi:hypothetical protein
MSKVVLILRKNGVITQPVHTLKPMKFQGYVIPEYFIADFYFVDNDGIDPKNDGSRFPTWSVQILFRTTKAETVEIVKIEILGNKHYKGYEIATTKPFNPEEYSTIQARHLDEVHLNRVRFISVAVQTTIQTSKYIKNKSGGHSWTILDNINIPEQDLARVAKEISEFSYSKLDGTFYQTFADRYRKLVLEGDKTPIKTLQNLFYSDKSKKVVGAYATTCRKKGLLPKAEQGKNSPIRKTKQTKGKGNAKRKKK